MTWLLLTDSCLPDEVFEQRAYVRHLPPLEGECTLTEVCLQLLLQGIHPSRRSWHPQDPFLLHPTPFQVMKHLRGQDDWLRYQDTIMNQSLPHSQGGSN